MAVEIELSVIISWRPWDARNRVTSVKNLLFVDDEDSIRLTLTPILKKAWV